MQEKTLQILRDAGFDMDNSEIEIPEISGLSKDIKKMIVSMDGTITREEIKTLVNLYYQIQGMRLALSEQIRSIDKNSAADVSVLCLQHFLKQTAALEKAANDTLSKILQSSEVGRWLASIKGIGPALGAGCLAYFDVTGKQYSSQFISYAGLNDNNRPWLGNEKSKKIIEECIETYGAGELNEDAIAAISAKTQWKMDYLTTKAYDEKSGWSKTKLQAACAKIPYNAALKTHMWKVGKSFEYLKSNQNSLYGRLLAERIAQEIKRNEEGLNKPLIEKKLAEKNYSKTSETYKLYMEGKLSLPEINARSRRWVQKIFVSHLFEEMYRVEYGKKPPRYYALEHCDGHHDEIDPEVPYFAVSE